MKLSDLLTDQELIDAMTQDIADVTDGIVDSKDFVSGCPFPSMASAFGEVGEAAGEDYESVAASFRAAERVISLALDKKFAGVLVVGG